MRLDWTDIDLRGAVANQEGSDHHTVRNALADVAWLRDMVAFLSGGTSRIFQLSKIQSPNGTFRPAAMRPTPLHTRSHERPNYTLVEGAGP
jgi:hypothetical protein